MWHFTNPSVANGKFITDYIATKIKSRLIVGGMFLDKSVKELAKEGGKEYYTERNKYLVKTIVVASLIILACLYL